jgi:hypothetical protein
LGTNGHVGIGTSAGSNNPILDIVTGVGDGTVNEAAGIRLRHSATNGNAMSLQLGTSNVGAGGSNQGYGYIQAGYWGGSVDNAGLGGVAVCQYVGLGEITTMLVTIPAATAVGVGFMVLLGRALGVLS